MKTFVAFLLRQKLQAGWVRIRIRIEDLNLPRLAALELLLGLGPMRGLDSCGDA